jgi:hypothetical protein
MRTVNIREFIDKLNGSNEDWKDGNPPEVVFLIGAGLSAPAGIPTTGRILETLLEMLYLRDEFKASFSGWPAAETLRRRLLRELEGASGIVSFRDIQKRPPLSLWNWVAKQYPGKSRVNRPDYFHVLIDAADEQLHLKGSTGNPFNTGLHREEILSELFQKLSRFAKPELGYHLLAHFLESWKPLRKVLTTNFDTLIQQILDERQNINYKVRPWNSRAYYDTPAFRGKKHVGVYHLHGESGTTRNLATSLGPNDIPDIQKSFHDIGFSTKGSLLIVVGYSGKDLTVRNALKAADHPSVFSRGIWWQIRPGDTEIRENLQGSLTPAIEAKLNFIEYERGDYFLKELCDQVLGNPLEAKQATSRPHPVLIHLPPPIKKPSVRSESLGDDFGKVGEWLDSTANLDSMISTYGKPRPNVIQLLGRDLEPVRLAAALFRDRRVQANFDVCWCDLRIHSNPSLLLAFLAKYFQQRDPQTHIVPIFRDQWTLSQVPLSSGRSTVHGEMVAILDQLRYHRYLIVFDGFEDFDETDLKNDFAMPDREGIQAFLTYLAFPQLVFKRFPRRQEPFHHSLVQSCCILLGSPEMESLFDQTLESTDWEKSGTDKEIARGQVGADRINGSRPFLVGGRLPDYNEAKHQLAQVGNVPDQADCRRLLYTLLHIRRPRSRLTVNFFCRVIAREDREATESLAKTFYGKLSGLFEEQEGGYLWFDEGLRREWLSKMVHLFPELPPYCPAIKADLIHYYRLVYQNSGDATAILEVLWLLGIRRKGTPAIEAEADAAAILQYINTYKDPLVRSGNQKAVVDAIDWALERVAHAGNDGQENQELIFRSLDTGLEIRQDLGDFGRLFLDYAKKFEIAANKSLMPKPPGGPKLNRSWLAEIRKKVIDRGGKYGTGAPQLHCVEAVLGMGVTRSGQREFSDASTYLRRALDDSLRMAGDSTLPNRGQWEDLALKCIHRLAECYYLEGDNLNADLMINLGLERLGTGLTLMPIFPEGDSRTQHFSVLQVLRSSRLRQKGDYGKAATVLDLAKLAYSHHPAGGGLAHAVHILHHALIQIENPDGDAVAAQEHVEDALHRMKDMRHNIWWWTFAELVHSRVHMRLAESSPSEADFDNHMEYSRLALTRISNIEIPVDNWRRLEAEVVRVEWELQRLHRSLDPISQEEESRTCFRRLGELEGILKGLQNHAIGLHHFKQLAKIHLLRARCLFELSPIETDPGKPDETKTSINLAIRQLGNCLQVYHLLGMKMQRGPAIALLVRIRETQISDKQSDEIRLQNIEEFLLSLTDFAAEWQRASNDHQPGFLEDRWERQFRKRLEEAAAILDKRRQSIIAWVVHFLMRVHGTLGPAGVRRLQSIIAKIQKTEMKSGALVSALKNIQGLIGVLELKYACKLGPSESSGDSYRMVKVALKEFWRDEGDYRAAYPRLILLVADLFAASGNAAALREILGSEPRRSGERAKGGAAVKAIVKALEDFQSGEYWNTGKARHEAGAYPYSPAFASALEAAEKFASVAKGSTFYHDRFFGLHVLGRAHILVGRYLGNTGRILVESDLKPGAEPFARPASARDGLDHLCMGLLLAEVNLDRRLQAEGYYAMARNILYKARCRIFPIGKTKVRFESWLETADMEPEAKSEISHLIYAITEKIRTKFSGQRQMMNRNILGERERFARGSKKTGVEIGMDPLNMAWGLVSDGEDELLHSLILHQKGRVEIERCNYYLAETLLKEGFKLASRPFLGKSRMNLVREILRCWMLRTHGESAGLGANEKAAEIRKRVEKIMGEPENLEVMKAFNEILRKFPADWNRQKGDHLEVILKNAAFWIHILGIFGIAIQEVKSIPQPPTRDFLDKEKLYTGIGLLADVMTLADCGVGDKLEELAQQLVEADHFGKRQLKLAFAKIRKDCPVATYFENPISETRIDVIRSQFEAKVRRQELASEPKMNGSELEFQLFENQIRVGFRSESSKEDRLWYSPSPLWMEMKGQRVGLEVIEGVRIKPDLKSAPAA